jgi:hypothetical protein
MLAGGFQNAGNPSMFPLLNHVAANAEPVQPITDRYGLLFDPRATKAPPGWIATARPSKPAPLGASATFAPQEPLPDASNAHAWR